MMQPRISSTKLSFKMNEHHWTLNWESLYSTECHDSPWIIWDFAIVLLYIFEFGLQKFHIINFDIIHTLTAPRYITASLPTHFVVFFKKKKKKLKEKWETSNLCCHILCIPWSTVNLQDHTFNASWLSKA